MTTVEDFLARPLVAHVAAVGPTVRPVWFLWEQNSFWWLTGRWSRFSHLVKQEPVVALVVDSCDLAIGEVLKVAVTGQAEVVPLQRDVAIRKLSKYLGGDQARWPRERFLDPLDDDATRLVRLHPSRSPVLNDLSF